MTEPVRTLLQDLASDARNYADADAALAAVRRRRRRVTVALPAMLVVAALAALGLASMRPDHGLTPDPSMIGEYPTTITPADDMDVTKLPQGVVGPASFLYTSCRTGCPTYVVLPDGRRYAVPYAAEQGEHRTPAVTLSPDGQWLGGPVDDDYTLRRLAAPANDVPVAAEGPGVTVPVAWSSNSRWVVFARVVGDSVAHYLLVDLDNGGVRHRVDEVPAGGRVVGLLNDGSLLAWIGVTRSGLPRLAIVDPVSGAQRQVNVYEPRSASDLLRGGEVVSAHGFHVSPGGGTALIALHKGTALGPPVAVLDIDLEKGNIIGRLDLPAADPGGEWEVGAYLVGGITLVHRHAGGTDIVVMNDIHGDLERVTRLPAGSHVVPRGAGVDIGG